MLFQTWAWRRATPVQFHPTRMLKSLRLHSQQTVATPMGPLRAEYLTFYDTGQWRRVLQLNGKLSGYWT